MLSLRATPLFSVLLLLGLPYSVFGAATVNGDLPRQADLGFSTSTEDGRLEVVKVVAGSPAARAGLAVGDRILEVNRESFDKPYHGAAALQRLDGGKRLTLA